MKKLIKLIKGDILNNIIWMFLDRFFVILLQFFIGVKIANYFGAEKYGNYSYAMSIIAFSPLILEIVNDRIIKKKYEDYDIEKIVSTVGNIRGIISIIIFLVIIIFKLLCGIENNLFYMLLLLSCNNIFINYVFGLKNYFEYKLNTRSLAKIDNTLKLAYYTIQYLAVILNYSLLIIIIIRVLGNLVRIFLLKKCYWNQYKKKLNFSIDFIILKKIVNESKFLWIASISYVLYAQLDKIMIAKMLGTKEVGIYSIATTLMITLFIPLNIIRVSFYPKLWKSFRENYENYKKSYKMITLFLTQFYLFGIVISIYLLPKIFPLVYSKEYIGAVNIFFALGLGIIVRANETLQYTHYTFKEISKIILYKQIFGLFFNIGANYILIKIYGSIGAAIATSLTLFFTRFIFDSFLKETREVFKIQLYGFNSLNLLKCIKINKVT